MRPLSSTSRWEQLARLDLIPHDETAPTQTLQKLIEIAERLVPATGGASIVLYDPVEDSYSTSVSTVPGQGSQTPMTRVREEKGATRWILDNAAQVAVSRLEDDPFGANEMLYEYGLAAYLGTPILDHQRTVLGVMYAMSTDEREWTEDDREFVAALGERAGQVLRQAIDTAERAETLRRADVARAARDCLRELSDPATAFVAALDAVARGVGGPCSLYLIPFAVAARSLTVASNTEAADLDATDPIRLRLDLLGDQAARRAISDTTGHPLPEVHTTTLIADRPLARFVALTHGRSWKDADRAILEDLATTLSIALGEAMHRQQLERSNAELEQFASVLTHDLRGPLTSVLGYLELTMVNADVDERTRGWIGTARTAAQRMSGLITALLAYARATDQEPQYRLVDLHDVIDDVLTSLRSDAESVAAKIENAVDITAVTDPEAFAIIVQNLVGNALRFHHADEVPDIRITGGHVTGGWEVAVRDHGPGVPERMRSRIFEMFECGAQASQPSDGDDGSGRGIGLAVVNRLVIARGGRAWVDPAPGGGSIFTVRFPDRILAAELDDPAG